MLLLRTVVATTAAVVVALLCCVALVPPSAAAASASGRYNIEHRSYRVARSPSTVSINSTHDYYGLRLYPALGDSGDNYWLQPDDTWDEYRAQYRSYVSVPLSFSFPFYGVDTRLIHIASGGFVSTVPGDKDAWPVTVESYYIAPLLADFDHGNTTEETVAFKDFGDTFVVQWRGVVLHTRQTPEPYSFQCVLKRDGTIQFYYKEVPLAPNLIRIDSDNRHPVEVGLADSYTRVLTVDGADVTVRYDYHSIDVPKAKIQNTTFIVFDPLPTCNSYSTCRTCAQHDTVFDCVWCPALARCSDGFDRYRDEFLTADCDTDNISPEEIDQCTEPVTDTYVYKFAWPATNFSDDCWYWLGIRVDHDVSLFEDRSVSPSEEGAGVTVSFALSLTKADSIHVLNHLTADLPLRCDGTTLAVSNAQRQAPSGSATVSTETIILISCAGVLAILLIAIMGVLFYGYSNPTTPLGQWMIRHRRCRGLCCSGADVDAAGNGGGNFDAYDREALQDTPVDTAAPSAHPADPTSPQQEEASAA